MNVISFALYGNLPKYCVGAIKNAELAAKFYPGFSCIYYIAPSVPSETCEELFKFPNVILQEVEEYNPSEPITENNIPGMFTRFHAFDFPMFDRVLSRDVDSRITQREVDAFWQWVESGKILWSCRDHPAHARPMNGGMIGLYRHPCPIKFMPSAIKWCNCMRRGAKRPIDYGDDQQFLCSTIWPNLNFSVMQHDSFSRHAYPGSVPFPSKRVGQEFMGEVFDENDQPRDFDRVQIPLEN